MKKLPKKTVEIDDEDDDTDDDSSSWNIDFGIPNLKSVYHHISMSGSNFSLDIATPVFCVDFKTFVRFVIRLSLFLSDDEIRKIEKNKLLKILDNEV